MNYCLRIRDAFEHLNYFNRDRYKEKLGDNKRKHTLNINEILELSFLLLKGTLIEL